MTGWFSKLQLKNGLSQSATEQPQSSYYCIVLPRRHAGLATNKEVMIQFHLLIRFVEIQTCKREGYNMNYCCKNSNIIFFKLEVHIKCKDPIITLRKLQTLFYMILLH